MAIDRAKLYNLKAMKNREKHDPNSQAYTNAILEDMDDKLQAVLEVTAPIPKMQEQISSILEWEDDVKMIPEMRKQIGATQKQVDRIVNWEENIKLIPAIFEEVGNLRKDVEILKAAMKLLDRHDDRMEKIEKRLSVVEQRVRG